MKNIVDNYNNVINYAEQKSKEFWWKLLFSGIIASVYLGLGYIAFIYILAAYQEPGVIAKTIKISGTALVVAAAIFPVGLMLIVFLGGSLFTSENLTIFASLHRGVKIRSIVYRWSIVLLGNLIGGFLIAIIVRLGGIFGDKQIYVLSYIIGHKMDLAWYMIFFSGILCNIIVAGSVWASLATKSAIGKIGIIWFAIWLFAIVGFQHIVANGILFAFGWLHIDHVALQTISGATQAYSLSSWSTLAILNLVMATIGNGVGGGIILPLVYVIIIKAKEEKLKTL